MRRLIGILVLLCTLTLVGFAGYSVFWKKQEAQTLNLLSWVGYEEPDFIGVFEKKYGVKVNYKTYVGGDQMFALLSQSKGQYDVSVVDPEYISKLQTIGKLAELNPNDFNFSDYYLYFKDFELARIGGKLYAVVIQFGSNGLVYNTDHVTADEANSYNILFHDKVKGRVGIWDWYVPSMGVISRAVGNGDAYNLTKDQFQKLKSGLRALRPHVRAIFATPPEMISSLANGETWIVPAAGEWVAGILQAQGKPIEWSVPKEGGIMWTETLVVAKDAPHPELAKKFIQWAQTPEAQALLTQRKAYKSNVPNRMAYALLSEAQRVQLHAATDADVLNLISRLSIRRLPQKQEEKVWQSAWEEFKAK